MMVALFDILLQDVVFGYKPRLSEPFSRNLCSTQVPGKQPSGMTAFLSVFTHES